MAAWKLAPALAAGNCVVLKPAEQTPASILVLMELIGDLLPAGRAQHRQRLRPRGRQAAGSSKRIAKIAFTGETTTGRLIMQYAAENLIPVTLELGGKSPNIFFADVWPRTTTFLDKALEGFAMFALNQGEVCTCPSRALIQESIYDQFMERALQAHQSRSSQGNPLDTDTMIGAQASNDQLEKILSYIDIGKKEGAKVLTGGERAQLGGDLEGGYYVQPTIFKGNNKMRIFQEEIFGPVSRSRLQGRGGGPPSPTTPSTAWAPACGRATATGLPHGPRIKAGRVWTNCYHAYPAHAAFGGYKQSGIGRENHDDARPLPADQEPAGQLQPKPWASSDRTAQWAPRGEPTRNHSQLPHPTERLRRLSHRRATATD